VRFILQPKAQANTRTYTVDFSPFVPVGYSLASATGTCAVSSGIDPAAAAMISNVAVDSTGYNVTFQVSNGVDGVTYLISLTGAFAAGSPYTGTTVTQTAYLTVVENQ
jgi:hypothetical protein